MVFLLLQHLLPERYMTFDIVVNHIYFRHSLNLIYNQKCHSLDADFLSVSLWQYGLMYYHV